VPFEPRLDVDVDENAQARLESITDLGNEHAVGVQLVAQLVGVVDNPHVSWRSHVDRRAGVGPSRDAATFSSNHLES
jgi:hypothetical protein